MTTLYTTTTQHINQKMDIEFHYYVTYLVYIKAGFNKNEAEIIAYASQYVDDNTAQAYVKSRGSGAIAYRSMITQTYDITLPKSIMHQIYIAFHFIPGFSSQSHSADMHRKDGKKHHMMTVAGSVPSRILMYSALQSGDLYWIGIATHAFLDTWAHQNFTGTMDDFNGFSDIKSIIIPNIGHADAMSAPDELCRKWRDLRLKNPKIDNNKRFLEAAFSLFSILFEVKKPSISKQNLILEWAIIEQDLITIWNTYRAQRFFSARERRNRIAEYSKIAIKYSGSPILEYDKFAWKREALTSVIGQYVYRWRDAELYRTTHWFCFQVAAVKQLEFVKNLLQAYSAYHLAYPTKISS